MALIGTERDAVQILTNRIAKEGDAGLANFARLVLGAHAEQAKRLADLATQVAKGQVTLDKIEVFQSETVQVKAETDGRELEVTLKADRLPITSYEELVDFYQIDTEVWKPTSQVFNFWGSGSSPNFQVKAAFKKDEYQAASAEDREAFRQWAKQHAPTLSLPTVGVNGSGKMLELVVADLHVDRVGGLEAALAALAEGAAEIFEKVQLLYGEVEEVNLILLGDTFNSDNGKDTTTAGTPQKSEADWRDTFRRTRVAVSEIIARARTFAPTVKVHVMPGNHDYERAFYLADSLWAYYYRADGIEVVVDDSPRRYLHWGNSVIGLTHGDRVKPGDLAMTMLREADIAGKKFLNWHLGHTHTLREDEVHGITFRWFRSPQAPSEWEEKNLYGNNLREITGIVWDIDYGPEDTFRYAVRGEA